MPANGTREPFAGPESGPEPPFPIKLSGPVIKGFGRGSKELGIPTANIPAEGLSESHPDLASGVYFGWVGLSLSTSTTAEGEAEADHATDDGAVYPCVLSVGFNPFYKNTVRSVEIHILHEFGRDFYGAALNLLMLGFIRPEYDYVSLEALVDDIRTDCDVATRSLLERDAYARFKNDPWLREFGWMKDEKKTEP